MRQIATFLLLVVCLGSVMSCSTIRRTQEKLDYLNQKVDNLRDYSDTQLAALEVKAAKTDQDLADVGITLDANADGKVSLDEAKAAATEVAKGALTDAGKRSLFLSSEFWLGLGGAVVTSIGAVVAASRKRRNKAKVVEA